MEGYASFFKGTTDPQIRDFVKVLKDQGEFDNKIFIIVSDHGHTAMPTNLFYNKNLTLVDENGNDNTIEVETPAEMSCDLKVDFQINPSNPEAGKNNRRAELANNNLHIWELAEIFRAIGENGLAEYKVLAPKAIASLYQRIDKATNKFIQMPFGATQKVDQADVIIAMNGPMAHVYVNNTDQMADIASLFRLSLGGYFPSEASDMWDMDELDYLDFRENVIGRLKESIDKILIRDEEGYCVFDGLNNDGTPKCASSDPFMETEYVNAWEKINGINHPKRSGDIVLMMKDKMHDTGQRYTSGTACKSWHGSLNRSDSYVPFIFAYPGGSQSELAAILKKDDICKDIYNN